jgi:hypothetical protein
MLRKQEKFKGDILILHPVELMSDGIPDPKHCSSVKHHIAFLLVLLGGTFSLRPKQARGIGAKHILHKLRTAQPMLSSLALHKLLDGLVGLLNCKRIVTRREQVATNFLDLGLGDCLSKDGT